MYYAGFSIICEGVAEFPTLEAMKEWLNHATEIDKFLGASWDAPMGARISFTPEQVNEMFGGSNFVGQLYQQTEPGTGPNIVWHYI